MERVDSNKTWAESAGQLIDCGALLESVERRIKETDNEIAKLQLVSDELEKEVVECILSIASTTKKTIQGETQDEDKDDEK